MTGHSFIQQFIKREEHLRMMDGTWFVLKLHCIVIVPHVTRHYAISTSMRMRSPLSFGFQTDRVFTCTLSGIRKGINHPLQFDRNVIELNRID